MDDVNDHPLVRITHNAHVVCHATDKKRGLTIDDVGRFVQDALRSGIEGDTPVNATVGWRSQLIGIEVTR